MIALLLHIVLLAIYPGCLVAFLVIVAVSDRRHAREEEAADREFCRDAGVSL